MGGGGKRSWHIPIPPPPVWPCQLCRMCHIVLLLFSRSCQLTSYQSVFIQVLSCLTNVVTSPQHLTALTTTHWSMVPSTSCSTLCSSIERRPCFTSFLCLLAPLNVSLHCCGRRCWSTSPTLTLDVGCANILWSACLSVWNWFGMWTHVDLKNNALDGSRDPSPDGGGSFEGCWHINSHCKA